MSADLEKAREALADLHTTARGHDYANEHDLNRQFMAVDDALDELEAAMRHRRQWRSIALDVICELDRLKTIEEARAFAKSRLESAGAEDSSGDARKDGG